MNQEEEIVYRRSILLDETKSNNERRIAQKRLMELLDIKEDNYTIKKEDNLKWNTKMN